MPAGDPCLRWAIAVSGWEPDTAEWELLLSLLESSARNEISFFKRREDQKRALVARLAVRSCVRQALGLQWGRFEIRRTRGKKPFLATPHTSGNSPNFNFNVSHEGDFVVLASEPLCLCGVDISAPPEARGRPQTLASMQESFKQQLAPKEWAAVDLAAETSEEAGLGRFRCFWSLKEAYVKARGDGLGFDLGRTEFALSINGVAGSATVSIDGQHDPRWAFYVQQLARGHWAAVARGPPQDAVDAWGEFRATFHSPNPSPAELQISDLIPAEAVPAYARAGGEVL